MLWGASRQELVIILDRMRPMTTKLLENRRMPLSHPIRRNPYHSADISAPSKTGWMSKNADFLWSSYLREQNLEFSDQFYSSISRLSYGKAIEAKRFMSSQGLDFLADLCIRRLTCWGMSRDVCRNFRWEELTMKTSYFVVRGWWLYKLSWIELKLLFQTLRPAQKTSLLIVGRQTVCFIDRFAHTQWSPTGSWDEVKQLAGISVNFGMFRLWCTMKPLDLIVLA